jgi:hypothetical protein
LIAEITGLDDRAGKPIVKGLTREPLDSDGCGGAGGQLLMFERNQPLTLVFNVVIATVYGLLSGTVAMVWACFGGLVRSISSRRYGWKYIFNHAGPGHPI